MQAYDLIMIIVLAMATIFGAIKGFAWQVASIASVIVSYIVAYRFRFDVAEMIQARPPWNQFLAMLILYVGTSFVIWVGFRLLSGMIDRVRLKEFDRHMGAAFGLAKGAIYCLLITMFAMTLLGPNQRTAFCQSQSGYYISQALDHGMGVLPSEVHDVVGPYLAKLDDQLKHGRSGETPDQGGLLPGLNGATGNQLNQLQNLPQLPSVSQDLSEALRGIQIPDSLSLPGNTQSGDNLAPFNGNLPAGGNLTGGATGSGVLPPATGNGSFPATTGSGYPPNSVLPPAPAGTTGNQRITPDTYSPYNNLGNSNSLRPSSSGGGSTSASSGNSSSPNNPMRRY